MKKTLTERSHKHDEFDIEKLIAMFAYNYADSIKIAHSRDQKKLASAEDFFHNWRMSKMYPDKKFVDDCENRLERFTPGQTKHILKHGRMFVDFLFHAVLEKDKDSYIQYVKNELARKRQNGTASQVSGLNESTGYSSGSMFEQTVTVKDDIMSVNDLYNFYDMILNERSCSKINLAVYDSNSSKIENIGIKDARVETNPVTGDPVFVLEPVKIAKQSQNHMSLNDVLKVLDESNAAENDFALTLKIDGHFVFLEKAILNYAPISNPVVTLVYSENNRLNETKNSENFHKPQSYTDLEDKETA